MAGAGRGYNQGGKRRENHQVFSFVNKSSLALIGVAALLAHSASAQVLFTTTNDWGQWSSSSGLTGKVTTAMDSDGSPTNGLGNTTAPGATGTPGALAVQWSAPAGNFAYGPSSPGEQGNASFLAALQQSGMVLTFDYTTPTNNGGSYFGPGIVVNCQGRFDQIYPSSTTALSGGWSRASIPWTSEASALAAQKVTNGGGFGYFQIEFIWNSNYSPTSPFYVDNIRLYNPSVATPANVTVNVTSNLFPISNTAYGMHTSVYDNQNGNAALPGLLIESGVNTLRYPGGGYADVFHWSVNQLSPWFGEAGNYGYQGPNTDFGSFVGLLSNAQCQAVITINFGSGQLWNAGHTQLVVPSTNAEPPEAAAWVAYANGNASLYGTTNDISLGTDSQSNNWRTVGFWAKLRSSTQAQYQSWATSNGVYDATFNFLAINRPAPVGIKYWEIGNETFGTGYYDSGGDNGYSVNYAVPYPYTSHTRYGNPALSPAAYGQEVKQFSLAMKAVDPTIKIGAVVSTPLGDYSWDVYNAQHWTPQVLSQCASNIDFIISHSYPGIPNNDNGNSLLPLPAANIPAMINGVSPHTGTSSGLKDWINLYRPNDPTNVSIFITEFGYMGSLTNSENGQPIIGPVTMLFDVDCYSTWMSYGVSNICFLEMMTTPFVGGGNPLVRGETFYGIKTLHQMALPGDMMVHSTSDTSTLRVQATRQQDGNVGVLLLNENMSATQTVNVTISNASLTTNGTRYIFGESNFSGANEVPTSAPTSNSVSGVGNSFSVAIPPYTMMVYTIPATVPVASFSAIPTDGAAPLGVTFTDTSIGSTNWSWIFGDSSTTNLATNSVVHTYNAPGVYSVTENVSGLGGSSTDTVANLISVYDTFAWWQLHYFGSTNNPSAAPGVDATGTGMSNTNKFLAGFNPTNSAAYLHVISVVEQSVAGNANVVVTYLGPNGDDTYTPGIASRTNVLDYMTGDVNGNYTNGIWRDTGQTNILNGGNGSGIVTDMVDTAIPSSPTNRFYRVRVLLP